MAYGAGPQFGCARVNRIGRRAVRLALGVGLSLIPVHPVAADVTADLVLSARAWQTDGRKSVRFDNFRLLADSDLHPRLRLHLDLDRPAPSNTELYELYLEWGSARSRLLLGRFQIPFGIYNRSELYYSGLINPPFVKYYPQEGPLLGRSEHGAAFVRAVGLWQIEAALFAQDGGLSTLVPSGGEGSIRLQRFMGPLIVGVSGLRGHGYAPPEGRREAAWFTGIDVRYSRPQLVLRGEWITGSVPGASPHGLYVDLLYHPVRLHDFTFVGRTERVRGAPNNDVTYYRQTIGFKWDLGRGTTLAINQSFESPRYNTGIHGTSLFIWHIRRL